MTCAVVALQSIPILQISRNCAITKEYYRRGSAVMSSPPDRAVRATALAAGDIAIRELTDQCKKHKMVDSIFFTSKLHFDVDMYSAVRAN